MSMRLCFGYNGHLGELKPWCVVGDKKNKTTTLKIKLRLVALSSKANYKTSEGFFYLQLQQVHCALLFRQRLAA